MEQYSYKIIDKKFEEAENEMKEQESDEQTYGYYIEMQSALYGAGKLITRTESGSAEQD
jgi:hypothetical protein